MSSSKSGTTSGKATERYVRTQHTLCLHEADAHLPGAVRWLSDRIVNVYVGPERKKWAVHEKLLTSQSDYFKLAFNTKDLKRTMNVDQQPPTSSGSTDDSDSLDLPDDDPKLFAMAIRWLYGITFAGRCEFPPVGTDGTDVSVRDYMALYVLASKLGVEGLKNAAVNVVYDYYHAGVAIGEKRRCPDLRDVRFVFERTGEDAQMRRLLVVSTLFYLFSRKDNSSSNNNADSLPAEWEEVLRSTGEIGWELIKMVNTWKWVMGAGCPAMTIKKRCSFHEHTEGGARCDD